MVVTDAKYKGSRMARTTPHTSFSYTQITHCQLPVCSPKTTHSFRACCHSTRLTRHLLCTTHCESPWRARHTGPCFMEVAVMEEGIGNIAGRASRNVSMDRKGRQKSLS